MASYKHQTANVNQSAQTLMNMPTWQRFHVSACCGLLAASIVYVACQVWKWPLWIYRPYHKDWGWLAPGSANIQMSFFGVTWWTLLAMAIAIPFTYSLTRFVRQPLPERWLVIVSGWSMLAIVAAGLFTTWNIWPF